MVFLERFALVVSVLWYHGVASAESRCVVSRALFAALDGHAVLPVLFLFTFFVCVFSSLLFPPLQLQRCTRRAASVGMNGTGTARRATGPQWSRGGLVVTG